MAESKEQKIQINKETQEWLPNQDTTLPIDGRDIPHFKEWVCWNSFAIDPATGRKHDGFDFAAYLTDDDRIIFGLPPNTPVRAVADGLVRQVLDDPQALHGDMYGVEIDIEHGDSNSGMYSFYIHVIPTVKARTEVKKGDIIGTLYKDPEGEEGRLVHLHLGLTDGWNVRNGGVSRLKDPQILSEKIYKHIAQPQGSASFKIEELPQAEIEVANFGKIRVNV